MFLKLYSRTMCWIGEMLGTILVSKKYSKGASQACGTGDGANGKCRPSPWTRSAEKLNTLLHPSNM